MKTILTALLLVLTGLELWAQSPPAFPAPPAVRRTLPRPGNTTNPAALPGQPPGAAAVAATAAAGAKALAAAEPEELIPPGTINFQGVELNQVLKIYAQLVGRTLLRANLPEAKIVLETQTPLTKMETIQALQAVLALNGISLVNIGDKFVKVVPSGEAGAAGGEVDRSGSTNLPSLGSYITHIVQLKYVKPTEMMPVITPFAKLPNSILSIDGNGILVLRDYAENVKRMLEMIEQVDVSIPAEYISEVIPIRYAKVDEIASALNSLGGSGGGATVSIGSSASSSPISGLANRTTSMGGGMNSMGGMSGMSGMSGVGGVGGVGSMGMGNSSAYGGQNRTMGTTAANPNGTPTSGSTFASRLNSIINRAGGSSSGGSGQDQILLFGQTKIIPNLSSSTLLVYATRKDMEAIKEIINKLDVPLAQVLIEAVIMNVKIGNTFDFGVSAAQKPQNYNSAIPVNGAGGWQNGSFLDLVSKFATNGALTGAMVNGLTNGGFGNNLPGGASWFGNIGPNWDVAVTAAQTDNNASIIQRPRIQTSQAKAAQFFVGDTVPYVTGNSYGGYGGNGVSYSQLSVGVELDVTPFINPDGLVVMQIQQQIDDLNGYTDIASVGKVPNTIKRTLNAEIAVRDRDTVMLGGFIKSDKSHTQSGVPFLSDIPVLGNLFKKRSDSKDRQELIVLIRPTVLATPEIAAKNTIKESQRLPGISGAAAEDAADERKLIDAQRKKELKKAKAGGPADGFFNLKVDDETNQPSNFGSAPQAAKPALQTNAPSVKTAASNEPVSSAQQKKLDALLNNYSAGKMNEQEYTAARDKIIAGGK